MALYRAAYSLQTTSHSNWLRVDFRQRCPVCDHSDWCLIAADQSAAICARVESPKPVGKEGAGWLHVLNTGIGPATWHHRGTMVKAHATPLISIDWVSLAASHISAITTNQLDTLASSLGVSVSSLVSLGCGWSEEHRSYCFPMKDGDARIVGIRLRRPNGFKFAVRGSRPGLFLPDTNSAGQLLAIGEGPTDCAALLDLGLIAVGRPSCSGGVRSLSQLVRRLRPRDVLIVADNDEPGQKGAGSLADELSVLNIDIRIVTPPAGVKDAREWKAGGATAADILTAPAVVLPHPAIRRAKLHAIQHRRTARS